MRRLFTLASLFVVMVVSSCTYDDSVENSEVPEIPATTPVGIEAVDLGLSVKWANCNVGASSPEEYGDYFAWGEVTPKDKYTIISSLTYDKAMGDISGDPQYDAATANWGSSWRMPTKTEIEELLNDCAWAWTKLNGIDVMEVEGPNGNSIFLPPAGSRNRSLSDGAGSFGNYWSSTPYGQDYNAYFLYFYGGYYDWEWAIRSYGKSIRPVSDYE